MPSHQHGVDPINNVVLRGKEGLERRRMIVLDMKMRGMRPNGIAKVLKVHRNTILRDMKWLRKNRAMRLEEDPPMEQTGDLISLYEEIAMQAIQSSHVAETEATKASFMQVALKALDLKAKLMLDTGLIQKAPEKHEHLHHARVEKLMQLPKDELEQKEKELERKILEHGGKLPSRIKYVEAKTV